MFFKSITRHTSRLRIICKYTRKNYSSLLLTNPQPLSINKRFYKQNYDASLVRCFSWTELYSSISQSTPVLTVEDYLINFHQMSGLPWWCIIMLTTLGIRTFIIFPLAVHQHQVIARLANLTKEMDNLAPELNKEVNIASKIYKWNENVSKRVFKQNMKRLHTERVIRDNCHPFKSILLAFIQMPVWISFSFALRNLTYMATFPDLLTMNSIMKLKIEGALWFKDLTMPDTLAIPVLLALVNLSLIEIHALRKIRKNSLLQNCILYTMRTLIIIVSIVATLNPTSVSFYWLCSSTFGLAQNMIFMFPKVRRICRIPATANESSTPFKDIANNIKVSWLKLK